MKSEIGGWQGVSVRKMFGHPCFMAEGKLFAFVSPDGQSLVLTNLSSEEREKLAAAFRVTAFTARERAMPNWASVAADPGDLTVVVPFLRLSYTAAFAKAHR